MFKHICLITFFSYSALSWAASTSPTTPANEKNYSGSYSCKGSNSKVGDYAYSLALKLNKAHSKDDVHLYDFVGETENSTKYSGNGVAIANRMALAFRISDYKDNIFGSASAVFKMNPEKLWTFTTQYYEPNDTGGTFGSDVCTQNPPPPKKVPEKAPDEAVSKKPVEEPSNRKPAEESTPKKAAEEPVVKKVSPDDSAQKKPVDEPALKKSNDETVPKKAGAEDKKQTEDKKPADEKKPADDTSSKKPPVETAPKKPAEETARN